MHPQENIMRRPRDHLGNPIRLRRSIMFVCLLGFRGLGKSPELHRWRFTTCVSKPAGVAASLHWISYR